ncbi:MAG: hypothetical protein JJE49_08200 [Peptostreptococcaceae bacterium]|nr:hypothetical protein [Peptostreptococcaceae bacterium]
MHEPRKRTKKHPYVTHPKEILKIESKKVFRLNSWLAVRITNAASIMVWVTYIAQTARTCKEITDMKLV